MSQLLVGFLGALVGAAFALAGSWIVARKTFKAVQITEQRALISETRTRLATLYAPALSLAAALRMVVHDQLVLWGNDTTEDRDERHDSLIRERRAEMDRVAALLALEPTSGELESVWNDMWRAFEKHLRRLRSMPPLEYPAAEQEVAIQTVDDLATAIEDMLKRAISDLDRRAEEIVSLRKPSRGWRTWLRYFHAGLTD